MMTGRAHQKILVVNIFGIGDVLFSTPLVANIRRAYPQAFIGYLCNRRAVNVLACNKNIDRIFVYEKDEWSAVYRRSKREFIRKALSEFRELKEQRFDLVVNLAFNKYLNWITWLLGAPRRVGFNYKNRNFLLTDKIPLKGYDNKHVIEYYLDLLTRIGITAEARNVELPFSESDARWAADFFDENDIRAQDKLVALIPGGGASWGLAAGFRRWAPENYGKLAHKIIEKTQAKIILLGDASEEELCRTIIPNVKDRLINVCGRTTIGQYAALLSRSVLAVVNDGGPLHVAVAAGTKTVSIFGPVDEKVYGPYPRGPHRIVTAPVACRPCYRRFRVARCSHRQCLVKITVDQVFKEIEDIL